MMILLHKIGGIKINLINAREEFKKGKSIFDMNLRVVYYARVSTESDEQLNSLENQKKFFEDYVKNSNNWELIDSYIDEGISGTSVNRRVNFMRMIEDAINGKFDMILTKEVSRFARNTIDSIKYTDYLLKNGVIVNFLNDNLNTIDETCEFRLTIMSSLAQDEVRKLSSRVKFGLERSVKDGKVLGGGNITGYYKEKGKLYIDEKEAPIVRMLFDLYSSGEYGFRKISEKLYEEGYHNSKGKPYADRVLSRMLTNPKYKGFYRGNISYIEDYKTHKKVKRPKEEWILYKDENIPAIVSEEIWDKANAIYASKSNEHEQLVGRRNYYNNSNAYTGKLVCKEHGCNFTRLATGNRANNPVWQCLEYARGGLKRCQTPTLYEKQLDIIFKEVIKDFIFNKKDMLTVILNDYIKFMSEFNDDKKIEDLNVGKLKVKKLKEKLLELCLDGSITNKEFKRRNDELTMELEEIEEELSSLNNFENNKNIMKEKIDKLENALNEELTLDKSFSDLFDLLIKRVYVSKINNDRKNIKFEIVFNYDLNEKIITYDFDKKRRSNFDNGQENRDALKYLLQDSKRSRS